MSELDKPILDLKKEVVEARNLVIKNDNVLKNMHADVRQMIVRQHAVEKRAFWTSASAYLIFASLASVGAFKYASSEIREKSESSVTERAAREKAEAHMRDRDQELSDQKAESAKALEIFQKLSGSDEPARSRALAEMASLKDKNLTDLEKAALKDKSLSLRVAAAQAAYDNGRTAFNRRDFKGAEESLTQYLKLANRPDDNAYNLLGNAMYQLHDYKGAVEPMRAYLKSGPGPKSAEYATMVLAESFAASGQTKEAIEAYRTGSVKFAASSSAAVMRNRAHRLEQAQKETAAAAPAAPAPQNVPVR